MVHLASLREKRSPGGKDSQSVSLIFRARPNLLGRGLSLAAEDLGMSKVARIRVCPAYPPRRFALIRTGGVRPRSGMRRVSLCLSIGLAIELSQYRSPQHSLDDR